MLQPKKTKFRKQQKGRMKGNAQRGHQLAFGSYGIKTLEEELQLLKDRPVAQVSEGVDYSLICMKADFNDLVARVAGTEKRNLEQDDRLTNNELRIEKLEKMISDPMERIMALEQAVANLNLELNNRPTV